MYTHRKLTPQKNATRPRSDRVEGRYSTAAPRKARPPPHPATARPSTLFRCSGGPPLLATAVPSGGNRYSPCSPLYTHPRLHLTRSSSFSALRCSTLLSVSNRLSPALCVCLPCSPTPRVCLPCSPTLTPSLLSPSSLSVSYRLHASHLRLPVSFLVFFALSPPSRVPIRLSPSAYIFLYLFISLYIYLCLSPSPLRLSLSPLRPSPVLPSRYPLPPFSISIQPLSNSFHLTPSHSISTQLRTPQLSLRSPSFPLTLHPHDGVSLSMRV